MSDIFDFAFDYGLTYFEPPSEKKDTLSREQYNKGNVDFYEQSLDDTLGTGISLKFKDDDEDDKKDDVNVNVVGESGEDQSTLSFSEMESVYDKGQISSSNIYDMSIGTYGDALSKAGFADKTPFNVFGQDIYTAGVPKTAEEAKKGLERFISKESLVNKGVKTGARMLGMNPMITSVAMGFANGKTVDDPLGNPSFRPNHFALGAIHDINMSIQYDNISAIQASLRDPKTDTRGFAQYINGQLVSRAPGKFAYSGTGAIGLSQEELQRIDALSKGIVPSTYDYKTETGTAGTPTGKGGMYDDRGRYHDINGTYGMGPRSASEAIGKSSGLGTEKIEAILAEVRADKTKNLNQEIAKAQAANFEAAQKAQREEVERQIREKEANTSIPDDYGIKDNIYSAFQATTPQVDDSDSGDGPGGGSPSGGDSSDMGFSTRYGGQIGQKFALGGRGEAEPAGFIEGPPEKFSDQTTIADDIPLEVKDGTFVINAPAVEYAGSDDISEMLTKAYEKAGQAIDKSGQRTTIPSREQISIMISRGEVVVPPQIAKIIGYDRLEKINNRGKKEVTRRQKQGDQEKPQARQANEGGFIGKAEGDKVTVYRGEPSKFPRRAELLRDKYTGSWFSPNKNFTKTYGEVAKTMELTFDEYKKGAKKAFLKKNISTRRMENRDAKLPPNLTRSQRSRIFQSLKYIDFMANEVKKGNRSTKAFADFMYEGVFPKEKDKATTMLLETAKRSPKAFGKLVVDSLVKNVVSKGIPVIGAVAGFAPKEMGDATLSGKEGFIYDYRTVNED